jgi:hypothetical protein
MSAFNLASAFDYGSKRSWEMKFENLALDLAVVKGRWSEGLLIGTLLGEE